MAPTRTCIFFIRSYLKCLKVRFFLKHFVSAFLSSYVCRSWGGSVSQVVRRKSSFNLCPVRKFPSVCLSILFLYPFPFSFMLLPVLLPFVWYSIPQFSISISLKLNSFHSICLCNMFSFSSIYLKGRYSEKEEYLRMRKSFCVLKS